MAINSSITKLWLKTNESIQLCLGCTFGKPHYITFLRNITKTQATLLGMLILSNIYGPMSVPSHGKLLYYILF